MISHVDPVANMTENGMQFCERHMSMMESKIVCAFSAATLGGKDVSRSGSCDRSDMPLDPSQCGCAPNASCMGVHSHGPGLDCSHSPIGNCHDAHLGMVEVHVHMGGNHYNAHMSRASAQVSIDPLGNWLRPEAHIWCQSSP